MKPAATLKHRLLGTLRLQKKYNWYAATVRWKGRPVGVRLSLDECDDVAALLGHAEAIFGDEERWDRKARDCAMAHLLATKNERWLEEGEAELTARQFRERLELVTVTLHAGGVYSFTFADCDMFRGHEICVSGTLPDGPDDAELAG